MEQNLKETLTVLNSQFKDAPPLETLGYFLSKYKGRIALASSMGAEDQVLTEMIASIDNKARVFTLDTGRMFAETYDVIDRTNARYKINIEVFFPERQQVEEMVKQKGINLFYDNIENRKQCCHIRKMVPLKRALQGLDVWISGLRKSQLVTRENLNVVEWDEKNGMIKLNPLIEWGEQQVWDYIEMKNIPYNNLHKQGFPSIGCQPCTRAVQPGEDIRAGRWWWENAGHKECGLHVK
ncbi:MAG: phosphoadenosine phosphosulfate reductase [Bacteroidetes bacterium 4484_276]|nr:MAG: phosphoadenosine phosphosulfate reductase [Bacteroidetes bacterium 4484_276]